MKNKIVSITIIVLLITTIGTLSYGTVSKVEPIRSIKANIDALIKSKLIDIDPPQAISNPCTIYVLGGSEPSLKLKFEVAASLYKKGQCDQILVLHVKGKTTFSPSLGRNFTRDEWTIKELTSLGIPKEKIQPIEIKEGFFGTFSEAKWVADYLKKNGISCITLITAPYHTRRAKISFQKFLKGTPVKVYTLSSSEQSYLRADFVELAKLMIYEHVLLRSAK